MERQSSKYNISDTRDSMKNMVYTNWELHLYTFTLYRTIVYVIHISTNIRELFGKHKTHKIVHKAL